MTAGCTLSDVERVGVMRGRHADELLSGPFAGARIGEVVAYEFELPASFEPWPGRTRRERTFVLLDLGVSFANPCWARPVRPDGTVVDRALEGRDTWYVDLVSVERNGTTYVLRDLYIDVMVPLDGRHYRMLDLDEFANAIDSGVLSTSQATNALRRWQRFPGSALACRASPVRRLDRLSASVDSTVGRPAKLRTPARAKRIE
jgi:Protein of unknown function (DUF402)